MIGSAWPPVGFYCDVRLGGFPLSTTFQDPEAPPGSPRAGVELPGLRILRHGPFNPAWFDIAQPRPIRAPRLEQQRQRAT